MLIGELAKRAGVNIQTIRFYERTQLLRKPERLPSGYRSYDERDLDDVRFIKQSQELGFTLRDIKSLLRLHDRVAALPHEKQVLSGELRGIVAIAKERLELVRAKLRDLQSMERQLRAALETLEGVEAPVCPASRSKRSVRNS